MRDIDWKILYELYTTPNITKVAEKLFMAQPTLTKRLQFRSGIHWRKSDCGSDFNGY